MFITISLQKNFEVINRTVKMDEKDSLENDGTFDPFYHKFV